MAVTFALGNGGSTSLPSHARWQGGRIVNVGAYAALRGGAGMGLYAASKAAIIRLTEFFGEPASRGAP